MKNWLRQHTKSLALTLARLARTPFASLLNIGVVGVALALPLVFHVVLVNVQEFALTRSPAPQISIFLALDAQASDARDIDSRLKKHAGIANVRFVPKDQALAELKTKSGLADVIASLGRNPLPDGFVVDARQSNADNTNNANNAMALEKLRAEFKAWPKVEHVQLDSAWARRLDAVIRLGRFVTLAFGTLLAFTLVAVTFNTIRLQIVTQRAEIEVAKLIGATNPFIRRPFLYYGAVLGLAGGLTAWAITAGGLALLNTRLAELAQLYGSNFALKSLPLPDAASLCLFAAGLGWLGAWLSASRNLAEFDPDN